MGCKLVQISILLTFLFVLTLPAAAQKACFTKAAREEAERSAKVWQAPDPGYDPALGYNPSVGPRAGAPAVDADGRAKPLSCVARKKENEGSGTTPKFYCSVPGIVDAAGQPISYKIKPHFKGQSRE